MHIGMIIFWKGGAHKYDYILEGGCRRYDYILKEGRT